MGKQPVRTRPWRVETVRGEPYRLGGRTLTPIARVIAFGQAKATIGGQQHSGWGWGFMHVTPLAMALEADHKTEIVPVRSTLDRAVWGMLGAAAAITLICAVIRRLAHPA